MAKKNVRIEWVIASTVLFAIGAILIVQGFIAQASAFALDSSTIPTIFGYYFAGILALGFGKWFKMRAMPGTR